MEKIFDSTESEKVAYLHTQKERRKRIDWKTFTRFVRANNLGLFSPLFPRNQHHSIYYVPIPNLSALSFRSGFRTMHRGTHAREICHVVSRKNAPFPRWDRRRRGLVHRSLPRTTWLRASSGWQLSLSSTKLAVSCDISCVNSYSTAFLSPRRIAPRILFPLEQAATFRVSSADFGEKEIYVAYVDLQPRVDKRK